MILKWRKNLIVRLALQLWKSEDTRLNNLEIILGCIE